MELNNDTLRKLRGLILYTVILVAAAVNYKGILSVGQTLLGFVWPFILGAAIAFILNVPMRNIERRLPLFRPVSRARRPVSLVITIVLVSGVLILVIFVVAPQLLETLMSLQSSIPLFLGEVFKRAEELFASYPELTELFDQMNQITLDWPRMLNEVGSFLRTGAGSMLNTTFLAAKTVVNGLSTFLIGFIFALYILLQKETLNRQIKKLLRAFLPDSAVERVLGVARLTERTFSSFLTGQCVEAVILGTMFFITLTVLRLPYALLIGVLIAFTALIPIFGAFIGMGVGVFLMLMEAPADALIFIITFFVLQQIEGNLIYPHVVGGSVGLPSIWVLAAVSVGGSMMGVVGMLIFIPLCSVFYALLREGVNSRLQRKREHAEKTEDKSENGETPGGTLPDGG